MNLQGCVPADLPPDQRLPKQRRHRGQPGSGAELPLPRTPPYVPGLALREGERRYHRIDSICVALHTVHLANRGTSRTTVIQRAESMLVSEECRADVDCVWSAMLALIYAGDLASAEAHCQSFGQDPAWAGSPRHRDVLTLARLRIDMLSGHAPTAVDVLDTLLSRGLPRSLSGLAIAWMVEILVQIGAFDRAHGLLLEHDLTGPIGDDFPDRALVLAARGALHIAAGQFRHGIEDYRTSGRLLTSWNVLNPAVIPWRSKAALGALAAHRFDLAVALAEDELAAARKWGSPRTVGCALHALALARRDDGSVALLEQAVELLDLAHARDDLIQALYDLSALQAKCGDLVEARSTLEAAGEVARLCRNEFWVERAESGLRHLDGPDKAGKLTKQELKIARLARAGYSNRRIAEALFLTIRTVEFHLSSAYRKLGISGRRELVAVLSAS
jgi:DNA-binding CsgD family transcriptional regulator